jgi:polyhydroxybutyrate depolymerase
LTGYVPQGLDSVSRRDPQGRNPDWQRLAGDDGNRDLKFFDAMLASMRREYRVDDRRIFSTGFPTARFSRCC